MTRFMSTVALAGAVVVSLALGVGALAYAAAGAGLTSDDAIGVLSGWATVVVGALVVLLRPGNRFGWVFLVLGLFLTALAFGDPYFLYLAQEGVVPNVWIAWVAEWIWIPTIYFAVVFWLMLFPDGRVTGPRWRIPFGIAVAACAVTTLFAWVDPVLELELDGAPVYELDNPIGIERLGDVENAAGGLALVACLLVAIASLVVRFRRSRGIQRQQIKLITLAGVAMLTNFLLIAPLTETLTGRNPGWLYALGFLLVPVAVGIAILRYGLFDVDLVIRKAVVYGSLTVILGVAYVGLVLAGQAVFSSFAGGSNLAIAVSTLVVAALFLPVRARVQGLVDRRFYRRRYDAQRTLEAFGVRVREEVDLSTLSADLRGVVEQTMQPTAVTLWLRGCVQ